MRLAEACFCTGQAAKSSTGPVSGPSRVCAVQSAVELEFASDLARAFSAEQVKVFDIHSERVHSLAIHVTADSERVGAVGIVAVAELGLGRWQPLISHSMWKTHVLVATMDSRAIEKRLRSDVERTADEEPVASEPPVLAEAVVGNDVEGLESTATPVLAVVAETDMAVEEDMSQRRAADSMSPGVVRSTEVSVPGVDGMAAVAVAAAAAASVVLARCCSEFPYDAHNDTAARSRPGRASLAVPGASTLSARDHFRYTTSFHTAKVSPTPYPSGWSWTSRRAPFASTRILIRCAAASAVGANSILQFQVVVPVVEVFNSASTYPATQTCDHGPQTESRYEAQQWTQAYSIEVVFRQRPADQIKKARQESASGEDEQSSKARHGKIEASPSQAVHRVGIESAAAQWNHPRRCL